MLKIEITIDTSIVSNTCSKNIYHSFLCEKVRVVLHNSIKILALIKEEKKKTHPIFFFQEEKKTVTLSSTLSLNIRD